MKDKEWKHNHKAKLTTVDCVDFNSVRYVYMDRGNLLAPIDFLFDGFISLEPEVGCLPGCQ